MTQNTNEESAIEAAYEGKVRPLRKALDAGVDPDYRHGQSGLSLAYIAVTGHITTRMGRTYRPEQGRLDCLQLLLDRGADFTHLVNDLQRTKENLDLTFFLRGLRIADQDTPFVDYVRGRDTGQQR